METSSSAKLNLHFETLPQETKKAFEFLSEQKWLEGSSWYLAGGTALALQTGIRKSVDLDFFTNSSDFEPAEVSDNFKNNPDWNPYVNKKKTIYATLLGAKVSFIAYPFFIPKQEYIKYGSISILQPRDIAVMKIVAISQRGKKRDFFDLYWCAHCVEPLIDTIKRLKEQYPSVAHDYHHILKAIVYFDDAESDPDPEINFDASWGKVKSFFEKEIPIILNELI